MELPIFLAAFYAAAAVGAQNTTRPSLPEPLQDDRVGWQDSPSRRGTWEIVVSCMTTVFACTWSIQHLNVPAQEHWAWKLLRSCKWMAITVLLPEFIMAHAFFELVMAAHDTERIRENTTRRVAPIPCLIDALVLQNWARLSPWRGKPPRRADEEEQKVSSEEDPEWTITHTYFANMGGFAQINDRSSGSSQPVTATKYAMESERYTRSAITSVTEDDINDKAKRDFFTKGLAVVQISQLLLSLVSRAVRYLPFSQLETLTLAFAVCGVATYAIYWYKPQGVGVPFRIDLSTTSTSPPDIPTRYPKTHDNFWAVITSAKPEPDPPRVKNDNIPLDTSGATHQAVPVLAVLSAAFGSLHLIAWSFEFPTPAEQLLWRVATVLSIAVPIVALATIPLSQIIIPGGDPREFMANCLDLLRELSWERSRDRKREAIEAARTRLEEIFNDPKTNSAEARRPYREIFLSPSSGDGGDYRLWDDMVRFMNREPPFQERTSLEVLPEHFAEQFGTLRELMDGNGPKKLVDNAKTNVFPQKPLLPKAVNLGILYVTSLIYCVSRLTIIGLAFSCLRSMPDGVYITTWARNVPAVQ